MRLRIRAFNKFEHFETGIVYNRQKDECRSTGNNKFLNKIAQLSVDFINFPTSNNKNLMLTSVGAVRAKSKTEELTKN